MSTTYQAGGTLIGVRTSPIPSPNAVCAENEHRHVRPQLQRECLELRPGEARLPKLIEREKDRRRVGASAAQAAAQRKSLEKLDVSAGSDARSFPAAAAPRAG